MKIGKKSWRIVVIRQIRQKFFPLQSFLLYSIFCLTYTQLHVSKLKEIALVFLEIFVPENYRIFSHFSSSHKITNILSHIKITFPCFDFFQIWNTYKVH